MDCSMLLLGSLGAKQTYLDPTPPPPSYSIVMVVDGGVNPSRLNTAIQREHARIRGDDVQYDTTIINVRI